MQLIGKEYTNVQRRRREHQLTEVSVCSPLIYLADLYYIPVSGLTGANLKDRAPKDVCPWYRCVPACWAVSALSGQGMVRLPLVLSCPCGLRCTAVLVLGVPFLSALESSQKTPVN